MAQDIGQQIDGEIERIRQIYCEDVLQRSNRVVKLLGRRCRSQILYTFLGYELKMGRRRITCPDISSARYLKLFSEIGLEEIRMPYDPTHTALLVAGLEGSLHTIHELLLEKGLTEKQHRAAVSKVYRKIRECCSCPGERSQ